MGNNRSRRTWRWLHRHPKTSIISGALLLFFILAGAFGGSPTDQRTALVNATPVPAETTASPSPTPAPSQPPGPTPTVAPTTVPPTPVMRTTAPEPVTYAAAPAPVTQPPAAHAPVAQAPVAQAPATHAPAPPAPVQAAAPSCHPLTNSGNCYEPGELCRNADHGVQGVAGDGRTIVCADNDGWRWEPA